MSTSELTQLQRDILYVLSMEGDTITHYEIAKRVGFPGELRVVRPAVRALSRRKLIDRRRDGTYFLTLDGALVHEPDMPGWRRAALSERAAALASMEG